LTIDDPKKNKKIIGDAHLTLFVGRLNPRTSEETLHKSFERYGKIVHLTLVRDIGIVNRAYKAVLTSLCSDRLLKGLRIYNL